MHEEDGCRSRWNILYRRIEPVVPAHRIVDTHNPEPVLYLTTRIDQQATAGVRQSVPKSRDGVGGMIPVPRDRPDPQGWRERLKELRNGWNCFHDINEVPC